METFGWASMLGGLAFFFMGLASARNGLQLAAGERLHQLMGRLTANRFVAVLLGAIATVVLQSSTATTVILVSFAGVQLLSLTQAFGVILGADIGTTFVVILLSFKQITEYALYIVAAGIVIERFPRAQKLRYVGSVILGFGMIFFGMHLMGVAGQPLKDSPEVMKVFEYLGAHPYLNLIIAAIFTSLVHASAITIGFAMALSFSGTLTFEAAIPIVLGANIGTCVTAGMSCFGMGITGKRVAVAHVLIKMAGVLIVLPFLSYIAPLIEWIDGYLASNFSVLPVMATSGKIALTHLLFNVSIAILFLPLVRPGVWLVEKLVPDIKGNGEKFGPKFLDDSALDTPPLAFAQVRREIMRIVGITKDMFKEIPNVFRLDQNIDALFETIGAMDDKVDILEREIRFYLAKVTHQALNESQAATQLALLTIGGEIEGIGDIVSKEMLSLATKKRRRCARFSDDGWEELKSLHALVLKNFELSIAMLAQPHQDIVSTVIRHHTHIKELEQDLRQSHLLRLHDKLPESYESSTIHLDILGHMRSINGRLTRIVCTAKSLIG